MRHPPARRRIPPKQLPPRVHFVSPAPNVYGVDLGEVFYQVAMRELLKDNGLLAKV
ncbi:MAG: hypothetical protein ACRYFZ_09575 [Janthinobacterium lividum]